MPRILRLQRCGVSGISDDNGRSTQDHGPSASPDSSPSNQPRAQRGNGQRRIFSPIATPQKHLPGWHPDAVTAPWSRSEHCDASPGGGIGSAFRIWVGESTWDGSGPASLLNPYENSRVPASDSCRNSEPDGRVASGFRASSAGLSGRIPSGRPREWPSPTPPRVRWSPGLPEGDPEIDSPAHPLAFPNFQGTLARDQQAPVRPRSRSSTPLRP